MHTCKQYYSFLLHWCVAGPRDFLLLIVQTGSGAHPSSYSMTVWPFSLYRHSSMRLITHLNWVPRLRLRGNIPPLPLYASLPYMVTTLPFSVSKFGACFGPYSGWSVYLLVSQYGGEGLIQWLSLWDLWYTKCSWHGFFPECFSYLLSVFHQWSILSI